MFTLANALPEGSGDGYLAAAYIVFFVILLIYVAIMALRLRHTERDLRDLQKRAESTPPEQAPQEQAPQEVPAQEAPAQEAPAQEAPAGIPPHEEPHEQTLEREPA
jgi:hypothetical protein